jgi:hypothetical protein
MKIPKAALIATGEEGQEVYDGTGTFVEVDEDHVEIDDEDLVSSMRGEDLAITQPDFTVGDQEWDIEDDD